MTTQIDRSKKKKKDKVELSCYVVDYSVKFSLMHRLAKTDTEIQLELGG